MTPILRLRDRGGSFLCLKEITWNSPEVHNVFCHGLHEGFRWGLRQGAGDEGRDVAVARTRGPEVVAGTPDRWLSGRTGRWAVTGRWLRTITTPGDPLGAEF